MTSLYTFGSQIGPIPLGELDYNFAVVANNVLTANTVISNSQPNITLLGTLTGLTVSGNLQVNRATLTNLSVTGNTYAGNTSLGNLAVNSDTILYGNLTVYGNTTTINSNTVVTNDLLLVLGNNQNSGLALNGAGLAVGNNSLATWRFNNATNSWQSNIAVIPTGNAVLSLGGTNNYWGTAYINTISAHGNVTGNYFVGNGSLLTGIGTYTNANVAAYLPTYTGNFTANNISASGNLLVTGSAQLSGGATAPTAANGTANSQVATTAFVSNQMANSIGKLSTNWSVAQIGNNLYFQFNGANIARLDTSGNFVTIGNVTAFGTL